MTMEREMPFEPETPRSYPSDAPVEPAARSGETRAARPQVFSSFAEMVAPRRWMPRDPDFGRPSAPARTFEPETSHLSRGTWVMVVFAGILLGTATTLLLAGA